MIPKYDDAFSLSAWLRAVGSWWRTDFLIDTQRHCGQEFGPAAMRASTLEIDEARLRWLDDHREVFKPEFIASCPETEDTGISRAFDTTPTIYDIVDHAMGTDDVDRGDHYVINNTVRKGVYPGSIISEHPSHHEAVNEMMRLNQEADRDPDTGPN